MRRVAKPKSGAVAFAKALDVPLAPHQETIVGFLDSLDDGSKRDDDLRLLRALSNDGDVPERHRDAFDDMLERLDAGQRELTEGQRAYARSVADEHGIDPRDPAEKNRDVPRGREVATPGVLSPGNVKRALELREAIRAARRRSNEG